LDTKSHHINVSDTATSDSHPLNQELHPLTHEHTVAAFATIRDGVGTKTLDFCLRKNPLSARSNASEEKSSTEDTNLHEEAEESTELGQDSKEELEESAAPQKEDESTQSLDKIETQKQLDEQNEEVHTVIASSDDDESWWTKNRAKLFIYSICSILSFLLLFGLLHLWGVRKNKSGTSGNSSGNGAEESDSEIEDEFDNESGRGNSQRGYYNDASGKNYNNSSGKRGKSTSQTPAIRVEQSEPRNSRVTRNGNVDFYHIASDTQYSKSTTRSDEESKISMNPR